MIQRAIEHLWLDFSETIGISDKERHDVIKYSTFARLAGVEDTPAMRVLYAELYQKHGRSNANIFSQEFDVPSGFWSDIIAQESGNGLYVLKADNIPAILRQLVELVPVSIFSNIDAGLVLPSLGVDPEIFKNMLSSADLTQPKPALEGYQKIVELSGVPANSILYVGDDEIKDIIPANSAGLQTGMIWSRSDLADYNFADFPEILEAVRQSRAY